MCRYCFEDESVAELVSPCDCKGSVAFVHQRCAVKWMRVSESRVCELCQADFRCEPSGWASFSETARASKREAVYFLVVFVIFMAPIILLKAVADHLFTGGPFGTYLLLIIIGVLFFAISIHHCHAPEVAGDAIDAAFGPTDEGRLVWFLLTWLYIVSIFFPLFL